MADYSSYIETTERYVVSLPNPTNAVEFEKALTALKNKYYGMYTEEREFDNTFEIESREDEIRISFQGSVGTVSW